MYDTCIDCIYLVPNKPGELTISPTPRHAELDANAMWTDLTTKKFGGGRGLWWGPSHMGRARERILVPFDIAYQTEKECMYLLRTYLYQRVCVSADRYYYPHQPLPLLSNPQNVSSEVVSQMKVGPSVSNERKKREPDNWNGLRIPVSGLGYILTLLNRTSITLTIGLD